MEFRPLAGLANPHLQTVFATVARPDPRPGVRPETWAAADGDRLDVDLLPALPGRPGVLVLHGLEGSSRAGYVRGVLRAVEANGWNGAALNFRSCGPSPWRYARTYHSGHTDDLDDVVARLRARWGRVPVGAVGFSLGANVLLKWMGERGDAVPCDSAVAVSTPFDLGLCAAALDRPGLLPALYRRRFLRSLKRKALAGARRHPATLDAAAIRRCRTFCEFDGAVTAPLNGFRDALDYWDRCSSAKYLAAIRRPTLLLSAADDPIVPPEAIPTVEIESNPHLVLVLSARGGHVGFVSGTWRRPEFAAERWALAHLGASFG